jgi:hypothetical protein
VRLLRAAAFSSGNDPACLGDGQYAEKLAYALEHFNSWYLGRERRGAGRGHGIAQWLVRILPRRELVNLCKAIVDDLPRVVISVIHDARRVPHRFATFIYADGNTRADR